MIKFHDYLIEYRLTPRSRILRKHLPKMSMVIEEESQMDQSSIHLSQSRMASSSRLMSAVSMQQQNNRPSTRSLTKRKFVFKEERSHTQSSAALKSLGASLDNHTSNHNRKNQGGNRSISSIHHGSAKRENAFDSGSDSQTESDSNSADEDDDDEDEEDDDEEDKDLEDELMVFDSVQAAIIRKKIEQMGSFRS